MKTLNITEFFKVYESIKVHHWVTPSHTVHKLLDDFLGDYQTFVDDVVECHLSVPGNELEVVEVQPDEKSFSSINQLLMLADASFDIIRDNIDDCPRGMQTIIDEVDKTMRKYTYLFAKTNHNSGND